MRQSSWLAVVLCAAGIVVSRAGRADEPNPHDKAHDAFVEGQRLIESGNCDAAVPKFRASMAYESSVGARLAIVTCIEGHDPVGTWRLLREAAVLARITHDVDIGQCGAAPACP